MGDVSTRVTPGLGGFLAFFVLALVLWLLMRNMNARLRRMRYRNEQDAAAQAESTDPTHSTEPTTEPTTGPSGGSAEWGAVDRDGNGGVVHHERDHGEDVEDLVEPEPPR